MTIALADVSPPLADVTPVKYEDLVAAYEQALVNVLRHHTAGQDYLELWVPDEDPVKSILNMIEAAQTAGRPAIAIDVSSRTISSEQARRLAALAAAFGDVTVAPNTAGHLVSVENLQAPRSRVGGAESDVRSDESRASAPTPLVSSRRANDAAIERADFEVMPALATVVAAEQSQMTHAGVLSEREGLVLATGTSAVGELSVLVEPKGHVIVTARHSNVRAGPLCAVADIACRIIEGRTVQDASDHAAIITVHTLFERAGRPHVDGILLPTNAGRAFIEVGDLVHRMRRCYAERVGLDSTVNFFDTPPSQQWQDLPLEKKLAKAESVVRKYCRSVNLGDDAIHVDRIEKDLLGHHSRIVAALDDSMSAAQKPILMRALERQLKTEIDGKLQLYLEPLKDSSKLRRL